MSGHTPGPWTVNGVGESYEEVARTRRGVLVSSLHQPVPREEIPNARLIAAAPELLDACRAALPLLQAMYATVPATFGEGPVNALVKAAIAKAEGK